jgi:hypothetical protein
VDLESGAARVRTQDGVTLTQEQLSAEIKKAGHKLTGYKAQGDAQ